MRALFLLTLFSISSIASAGAKLNSKCGAVTGVRKANYCIYSNSFSPKMTIWFFHGIWDSEKVFTNTKTNLPAGQDSYADLINQFPDARIVTVSFGISWLMTAYADRKTEPLDATVSVFVNKIIPFIESQATLPKPYVAMGHSMGGYNASTLCSTTGPLFAKCILLNPMITSKKCDPYSFAFSCNQGPNFLFRWAVPKEKWPATAPLVLVQNAVSMPASYVTGCSRDGWGFYEGLIEWTQEVNARGFKATWDPVVSGSCDHDHWPTERVMQFLNSP